MNNKKISQLPTVSILNGAELIEVIQNGVNKKSTIQRVIDLSSSQNPKIYIAYVVPGGGFGGAPLISVLINTLGGDPIWSAVTSTQFNAVLNGVFIMGKTMAYITYITTNFGGNFPVNNDDRTIIFESSVPFMVKIEIYP